MQSNDSALQLMAGSDGAWKITLRDRNSRPIATYTNAAGLTASCWRGDSQAELFAPTATWIDATSGTIRLAISAAQSTPLTTGLYELMVKITANGLTTMRPIAGGLKIIQGPGAGTPRPVYATYRDMKRYAGSWLDALMRLDVDQTGFAEELADAREELDDLIQRHYRGGGNVLGSALTGYSPWTGLRYGFKNTWLQGLLDADALVLTKGILEYCSLNAIAAVCRRQVTPDKDNGYLKAASHFALRAEDVAAGLSCEIATSTTPNSTLLIHLGTADRLKG